MSAAGAPPVRRRVVVVFQSSVPGETSLSAAAALAARLSAELTGVFLEDVNLMRLAELPFAQELGRVSAVLRPIAARDIEREFRVQSARARRALEAAAAAMQLEWSFEAVRGPGLRPVLALARELDLVVLAMGAEAAAHGTSRPVAVLFDGSAAAGRALEIGELLAAAAGVALVVLIAAPDRAAFEAARAEVSARLRERQARGHAVWLKARDATQVCRAVRSLHAGLLLWSHSASPGEDRLYARLGAELPCPFILVR